MGNALAVCLDNNTGGGGTDPGKKLTEIEQARMEYAKRGLTVSTPGAEGGKPSTTNTKPMRRMSVGAQMLNMRSGAVFAGADTDQSGVIEVGAAYSGSGDGS